MQGSTGEGRRGQTPGSGSGGGQPRPRAIGLRTPNQARILKQLCGQGSWAKGLCWPAVYWAPNKAGNQGPCGLLPMEAIMAKGGPTELRFWRCCLLNVSSRMLRMGPPLQGSLG